MKLNGQVQFVLSMCVLVATTACGIMACIHVHGLHWANAEVQEAMHFRTRVEVVEPSKKIQTQQAEEAK